MSEESEKYSFQRYISECEAATPLLPLIHATDAYSFRKIIETSVLSAAPCRVFKGKEILYCFYGRPSYRPNQNVGSTRLTAFFPVAFILRASALTEIDAVFPFDTGAFEAGVMDQFLYRRASYDDTENSGMRVWDFTVPPDIESCARIVTRFYGGNREYIFSQPSNQVDNLPLSFEVECYKYILKEGSPRIADERIHSIEIQSSKAINLSSNNVLAVGLPQSLLDDEMIARRILEKWKARPITYSHAQLSPSDQMMYLRSEIEKFLHESRII